MATLLRQGSFGALSLVKRLSLGYTDLVASVAGLFDAGQISIVRADPDAAERAAQLFIQARIENSNLELDWLWYATNMTSIVHKRYCLRRALEINPDSELARRELAKLALQEDR